MSTLLNAKSPSAARIRNPGSQRATRVIASAQVRAHALASAAAAAVAASALLLSPQPALATGIESIELPSSLLDKPAEPSKYAKDQKQKLAEADEAFQSSNTLKELLARSEANKAKNRKEIQNKYCYRQAELGVGDCGGLRYIPGLTENGKQKTPKWLADLLGVETPEKDPSQGKTLRELIYNDGEAGK